jgi:hypothetical protein
MGAALLRANSPNRYHERGIMENTRRSLLTGITGAIAAVPVAAATQPHAAAAAASTDLSAKDRALLNGIEKVLRLPVRDEDDRHKAKCLRNVLEGITDLAVSMHGRNHGRTAGPDRPKSTAVVIDIIAGD